MAFNVQEESLPKESCETSDKKLLEEEEKRPSTTKTNIFPRVSIIMPADGLK